LHGLRHPLTLVSHLSPVQHCEQKHVFPISSLPQIPPFLHPPHEVDTFLNKLSKQNKEEKRSKNQQKKKKKERLPLGINSQYASFALSLLKAKG